MQGIEGAATTVAVRLAEALPAATEAMRARYGVTEDNAGALPDVITVGTFDRPALGVEEWPAVLVAGLETQSLRRADVGAGVTGWQARYLLRAYVYVRGEGETVVDQARKRLALCVRELVLGRRALGDVVVDDTSLSESYSDILNDKQKGTVGAAWVEFAVVVEEQLVDELATRGQVTGTNVDTTHLPQHPALS